MVNISRKYVLTDAYEIRVISFNVTTCNVDKICVGWWNEIIGKGADVLAKLGILSKYEEHGDNGPILIGGSIFLVEFFLSCSLEKS